MLLQPDKLSTVRYHLREKLYTRDRHYGGPSIPVLHTHFLQSWHHRQKDPSPNRSMADDILPDLPDLPANSSVQHYNSGCSLSSRLASDLCSRFPEALKLLFQAEKRR